MAEHEARRAYYKSRYDKRRALGMCVTCGKPLEDKRFARCADCRQKANDAQKAHTSKRREAGLCRVCGMPNAPTSTLLCEKHLVKNYEATAKA